MLNIILCYGRPVIIRLNRYFVGFVVIRVARGAMLITYGAIAFAYSGILKWWFTFTRFDGVADPFRYFRLFW